MILFKKILRPFTKSASPLTDRKVSDKIQHEDSSNLSKAAFSSDILELNLYFNNALGNEEKIRNLAQFIKSQIVKKESAELHFLLGSCYKELKEYDSHVSEWKIAYSLDSENKAMASGLLSAMKRYDVKDDFYNSLLQKLIVKREQVTIDRDDLTVKKVKEIFQEYGFVIIENFLDKNLIKIIRDNFLNNIESSKNTLMSLDLDPYNLIYPIYFCGNGYERNSEDFLNRVKEGFVKKDFCKKEYIREEDLIGLNKIVDSVGKSELGNFISDYTNNKSWCLHDEYSMARAVGKDGYQKGGFDSFHQDGRIQYRIDKVTTLWIPLTICGVNKTSVICAIPGYFSQYFPYNREESRKNCPISYEDFPDELIFKPDMNPGDIWLHNGLTVHGTYSDDTMLSNRMSVDLRLF